MIQLAREASSNTSAHVCAITWFEHTPFNLQTFLTDVVDIHWYKIIDEKDPCIDGLQYHAALRTAEFGTSDSYVRSFGSDARMIRSHPIDIKVNMQWMQKDATNVGGRPVPHGVLIQKPSGSGRFSEETLLQLRNQIHRYTSLEHRMFYGNESVLDTVKLLNVAGSIVGYYGDAWVNGLFASYAHCNLQLSTYSDLRNTQRWRINQEVKTLNPLGEWYFKHIPLTQLLEGNNVSRDEFSNASDKDHLIENLPWVPLSQEDIVDVSSRTYLCWAHRGRAYREYQDAFEKE